MKTTTTLAALVVALGFSHAQAQTPLQPLPVIMSGAVTPTHSCCHVAANTVVELELTDPVSSKDRKHGDQFGLRLHSPLMLNGVIVLPAGTPGIGEVVHADRARGGGKPGELILAARYLQVGGGQLPLHGMKLGIHGKDNSQKALAASIAIGVWAEFIHGGEIEIPAGTTALAKLAQDFDVTQEGALAPASIQVHPSDRVPEISESSTTTLHQE